MLNAVSIGCWGRAEFMHCPLLGELLGRNSRHRLFLVLFSSWETEQIPRVWKLGPPFPKPSQQLLHMPHNQRCKLLSVYITSLPWYGFKLWHKVPKHNHCLCKAQESAKIFLILNAMPRIVAHPCKSLEFNPCSGRQVSLLPPTAAPLCKGWWKWQWLLLFHNLSVFFSTTSTGDLIAKQCLSGLTTLPG